MMFKKKTVITAVIGLSLVQAGFLHGFNGLMSTLVGFSPEAVVQSIKKGKDSVLQGAYAVKTGLLGSGPYAQGFNVAGLVLGGLGLQATYALHTQTKGFSGDTALSMAFGEWKDVESDKEFESYTHNYFSCDDEHPNKAQGIVNTSIDYFARFPWLPVAGLSAIATTLWSAQGNDNSGLVTGTIGLLSATCFAYTCRLNKVASYPMTKEKCSDGVKNLGKTFALFGSGLGLLTIGTGLRFAGK